MAGTRHTRKATRSESCTGKKRFLTHGAAARYARFRVSQGAAPWHAEVYSCRFCEHRHVGHRPATKFENRARR